MKITTQKRFIDEEFPKEPRSWISRLTQPLNAFLEQMSAALTGQLTLADNIKSKVYKVDIEAGQRWPLKLSYTLNENPSALLIGNLHENPTEADATTLSTAMPVFSMGTNTLEVTIAGLDPLKAYRITLVAIV